MTESLLQLLIPPDENLFFTKSDPHDVRMGDITVRDLATFPAGARAALIGVPQDIGVQRNGGRVGAADAPDAIRRLLYKHTPYDIAENHTIPNGYLFDMGNVRCDGTLENIHARLTTVIEHVVRAGLIPITLGGGHDITYATVSGVVSVLANIGVVNMDAHLDVRSPNPLRNSGTSFRMLIDEAKLTPSSFAEFGIQSFVNSSDHLLWLESNGGHVISLDKIRVEGFEDSLHAAMSIATSKSEHMHGSLDIDAVRAADAPGVSASLPDGFTAAEFLHTAWVLGSRRETVSLDIVEVNPIYDRDDATARLAARAVMEFLVGTLGRG